VSNSKKSWWTKTKEQGEGAGISLLLLGIVFLLICAVLVLFTRYDTTWLLGVSIGTISIGLGFTSIGVAEKAERWARARLVYLQGTVDEERLAALDLARSPQSRTYQLTGPGTEDVLYDSTKDGNQAHPFYFGNAWIRLDSMQKGDVVRVRLYVTEDSEKTQVTLDEVNTYAGSEAKMIKISGGFYNKEGIQITAEHLVMSTTPIMIGCYIYDARRGG